LALALAILEEAADAKADANADAND